MDILEVITGRRSIRKYKDAPVEREKIKQLLNLARMAPSALGIPQSFRVVGLTPLGYPDQETQAPAAQGAGRGGFLGCLGGAMLVPDMPVEEIASMAYSQPL